MAMFLFGLLSTIATVQTVLSIAFICGLLYRLKKKKNNVCIVVLGDIGRSPRMQYHAVSYLKEGFSVNIVGYRGSSPVSLLRHNKNITFTYLIGSFRKPKLLPGILFYIFKAGFQAMQLLFVLLFIVDKPGHFLIQNPPSIPTMAIVWIVCCIKGSFSIIDWHNYAYTIMALNLKGNKSHILVKFSKWFENTFGRLADRNICVTAAMKDDLKRNWNVDAAVLYDRPPEYFHRTSLNDMHYLFKQLSDEGLTLFKGDDGSTIFSYEENGEIFEKKSRPAIIISSTSWTEDEDFSLLLKALEIYENQVSSGKLLLPKLICIITGKGPLKSYYNEVIAEKNFKYISIVTPWLSPDDYPKIIGSGDVGVCLHTSSSGLDLPMKVVDMFGCSLPVCAVGYQCLNELVKHDVNGLIFNTSDELASQLVEILEGFPSCAKLKEYRTNLQSSQKVKWHENWENVVLPLVKQ